MTSGADTLAGPGYHTPWMDRCRRLAFRRGHREYGGQPGTGDSWLQCVPVDSVNILNLKLVAGLIIRSFARAFSIAGASALTRVDGGLSCLPDLF